MGVCPYTSTHSISGWTITGNTFGARPDPDRLNPNEPPDPNNPDDFIYEAVNTEYAPLTLDADGMYGVNDSVISNNTFVNCRGGYSGGILLLPGTGNTIEANTFVNVDSIYGAGAILTLFSESNTLRDNIYTEAGLTGWPPTINANAVMNPGGAGHSHGCILLLDSYGNTIDESSTLIPTATISENTQILDFQLYGTSGEDNVITDSLINYKRAEISQRKLDSFEEGMPSNNKSGR